MSITTTLVQDSFTSAHFSVVSGVNDDPPVYTKYDIRVVPNTQSTIGTDAGGTTTKISPFTLTAVPTIFLIPTTNAMQSGLYRATMRLYTDANSSEYDYEAVGVFYYDTRTFTVDPIEVASNNSSNAVHKFSHSTPVVKVGGVALLSNDAFYSYVKLDWVNLSCTKVEPSGASFAADDEYNLGEQPYSAGTTYDWNITAAYPEPLPSDAAYECWGYIRLDNSATVVAMVPSPNSTIVEYIKPSYAFVLDFVSDDTTVGYHLELPAATLVLGDVVGTVSDNPIALTLSNIANYADYPFDSIEVNIRATSDVTTAILFTGTKNLSDFAGTSVNFEASLFTNYINGADTTSPIVNLENGVNYFFETVLKFTDSALFTPVQQRAVVTSGEFSDRIVPVTEASVVNSWTLEPTQGAGLVVSLKKTSQFMGNNDVPYNLDMYGVTTVLVEYNVLNSTGLTTWEPLSGGSIEQGSVTYSLDATNTDGVYTIPQNPSSASLGSAQPDVTIYAVIPDPLYVQTDYNLVAVRLTLVTTNPEFAVLSRTSIDFTAPAPAGYTYPFTTASVRFFPKPADHDFTTDVPFITGIVSDVVAFSVPVSVNPYFKAVVTSDGSGADFGSAADHEYDGTLPGIDSHDVTGLSYPVSYTGATFVVSVEYVYLENAGITTVSEDKTVQQQGVSPITVSSVVNSWTMDNTQGAGLVVSFTKTDQFMGENTYSYNLDASGNQATVLVEYNVLDDLTTWEPLIGGSIAQGSVTYALDATNTTGVYAVPQLTSGALIGDEQAPVFIYAVIPGQADYNLVVVRLTLRTESAAYDPLITNLDPAEAPVQVSDAFSAPAPAGYTYPVGYASVRFFPAPADHDFNTDKPVIQLGDAEGLDKISFNVPVSVPRYFRSVVETSGAGTVSGTATTVGNDDAAASSNVTGLSYVPTADQTFSLSVSYEYSENTTVSSDPQAMSVQMQGFPNPTDKGFTIVSASWNQTTQELEYELDITATATSAVRMDGWNVYTKLSTETGGWPVDEALVSSGLTHSVSLSSLAYPDFSTIDVKVVATRSKYLDSADTDEQTETNSDNVLDAGIQTTQITILPNTLPKPAASDIVLTNIVYDDNAGGSQYASLAVTVPASADGVRITNTSDSSTSTSTTLAILITSTPTAKTFTVEYKYDSIVTGSATTAYSDTTTVSFTTGLSNASIPVITSKAYVDEYTFTVTYTSTDSSYTSADMSLTSTVEALSVGSSDPAVNFGANDGSVNLSDFKSAEVIMSIGNLFAFNYYVDDQAVPGTQVVQSDAVTFYVAANPAIGSSIAVRNNTVTFPVNNNGDPNFNFALIVITQDSSIAVNDSGTYALALFSASGGFEVGTIYVNVISGGAAHTLTVTITGTDYDTVTSFSFQSASALTTADANVVLYVANTIEGADSVATSVTPTQPIVPTRVTTYMSDVNYFIYFEFGSLPTEFNSGDTIVYSGATGDLSPLNGTYTISNLAGSNSFVVGTTVINIVDSNNLVPETFDFGTVL